MKKHKLIKLPERPDAVGNAIGNTGDYIPPDLVPPNAIKDLIEDGLSDDEASKDDLIKY